MLLLLLLLTLVVGEASVEGVSVYFFYCSLWLIMIDTAMEVCKSHMIVVSYATTTTIATVNKNNTPDTDNRMNVADEAYCIVSCSRYRSRFTLSNIFMAFKATLKLEYLVSYCKHTHMSETYIMPSVKILE